MLGPHTVIPVSLPLFKTLCKTLCWNRHQLPCCIFLNLIPWSEISSLSKVILALRKARSCTGQNLGCSGAESPGGCDGLQKNSAQNVAHERVRCHDEAAGDQLPIAVAIFIVWHLSANEEH